MRTARLLTVSQHALMGGVPAQGVYLAGREEGVCTFPGMYLAGGVYLSRYSSPPNRILDTRYWKYYLAPNFVCGR